MKSLPQWMAALPFATASAACFYAALLAALLVPNFRRWLEVRVAMPAPSASAHLAPLDTFRGLAALYVAFAHMWQWPQPFFDAAAAAAPFIRIGAKAVPMFVILSGFLIYRSLRYALTAEGIRLYLRRRFLRIFPLYAATVIAFLAVSSVRIGGEYPVQSFLAELLMVRGLGYPAFMNPPAWSLYVEVVFYVMLPIYLIAVRSHVVPVTALLGLALILTDPSGPREFMLWKYFCFGILCCEAVERYRERCSQAAAAFVFSLGAALLYIDIGRQYDWVSALLSTVANLLGVQFRTPSLPNDFTTGLAFGTSLVIFGAVLSRPLIRMFSAAPLVMLGAVSYSVFMWHSFVIAADLPIAFDAKANIVATGPLPSVAAPGWTLPLVMAPALLFWSTLSFLAIERPFLRMRPRSHPSSMPPAQTIPVQ